MCCKKQEVYIDILNNSRNDILYSNILPKHIKHENNIVKRVMVCQLFLKSQYLSPLTYIRGLAGYSGFVWFDICQKLLVADLTNYVKPILSIFLKVQS